MTLQCGIWSIQNLWAEGMSSLVTDLSPEREEARTSGFQEELVNHLVFVAASPHLGWWCWQEGLGLG